MATEPFDLLGDFRFLPESSTGNTRGQLFQVLESDGGGGEAEAASLGPGGSFIAVPWTLGCGCAEEGWGDTIWVSPGDTVAFLLTPTRKEDPPRGPPVFDVLGWHQPYPAGEMIPYWRKERVLNPDWLTPREFFGLLEVLPGEAAFRLDPGGSYHGVRAWSAERPERRTAFPLSAILSAADAGLMRVQGGSPGPGGGAR